MDGSERLVEQYLHSLGYTDVIYEPDGNVTPDFLVNGRIAVEVRRLNQNYIPAQGKPYALEETEIPLWHGMERLLPSLGGPVNDSSWFVGLSFQRPHEPWKRLKPKIAAALQSFIQSPQQRKPYTIRVADNFALDLIPASTIHESAFIMGGSSDEDAGGFILGEIEKNLRICIAEKESKTAHHRHRYPEWWLVLPDFIGYGVDLEDHAAYRQTLSFLHDWDKVVLIDPRTPSRFFEI